VLPGRGDDLADLLSEAVRARVLTAPAAPLGPYRFAHDLFRETIYGGLPAAQRAGLHLAVAGALAELSRAVGLGGRPRRLGDDTERARKAVSARIHDAVARIERVNPALGRHLRQAVATGTHCSYTPPEPVHWRL
jgi:hypothetical protein